MSAIDPWGRDEPWINHLARPFLEAILGPNAVVFEWGSGASTLYLARRVRRIVTVEHDPDWISRVRSEVAAQQLDQRVVLHAVPMASRHDWRPYIGAIKGNPERFDLVVVDGRRRLACATAALQMLKPGGWLLLDNSERDQYRPIWAMLLNWDRASFQGPGRYKGGELTWETTFFRRPEGG